MIRFPHVSSLSAAVLLLAGSAGAQDTRFRYETRAPVTNGGRSPSSLAFAPDDDRLYVGYQDGTIVFATPGHLGPSAVHSAAPGRAIVALAAGPGGDAVYFATEKRELGILKSDGASGILAVARKPVSSLAASPAGGLVAVGTANGSITVFSAADGALSHRFQLEKAIVYVGFKSSARGLSNLVAVSSAGEAAEWDVRTGELRKQFRTDDSETFSASLSSDGRRLLLGTAKRRFRRSSGRVRATDMDWKAYVAVVNLESGLVEKRLEVLDGDPVRVSFSADGAYGAAVVRGFRDVVAVVFDLEHGHVVRRSPPLQSVSDTLFSPAGGWLAYAADSQVDVAEVYGVGRRAGGSLTGQQVEVLGGEQPLISAGSSAVVAIFDLESEDGDRGAAGVLSDLLRASLGAIQGIRIVDRRRLEQVLGEQDLQRSGRTDAASRVRVGRILNATSILSGRFGRLGSTLSLSVELIDVETARAQSRLLKCERCVLEDLPGAVDAFSRALAGSGDELPAQEATIPLRVEITAPGADGASAGGSMDLRAQIWGVEGLAKWAVVHNGVPIGGSGESVAVRDLRLAGESISLGADGSLAGRISLRPGRNIITVRALDAKGQINEETRVVRYLAEEIAESEPDEAPAPKVWLLMIGVSQYKDPEIPDLQFASSDVLDLCSAFAQSFSLPSDEACSARTAPLSVSEADGRVLMLLDEQATKGRLEAAFRSFLQRPAEQDTVLIYLAGHGTPDPNRPDNIYFVPHDARLSDIAATAVPLRDLEGSLRDNLRAANVILFADACHSGALGTSDVRGGWTPGEAVNRTLHDAAKRVRPGAAVFTSARSGEVALEGPWGLEEHGHGHGVFAWRLLQGVAGEAEGFGSGQNDGVITLEELLEFTRWSVKRDTNNAQSPTIVNGNYDIHFPVRLLAP